MKVIKCVIVGDADAEKTSVCISFTTGRAPDEYVPTVLDNYSVIVMIKGEPYSLGLWDTAGQEDYDRLRPLSYVQTDVFLVVFSVVNPSTFENAKEKWVPEITHFRPGTPFLLIGNKVSLRNDPETLEALNKRRQRPVSTEQGEKLAKKIGAVKYLECDHMTRYQLNDIFNEAILVALDGPEDSGGSKGGSIFSNILTMFKPKKKPNKNEGNNDSQNKETAIPDEILDMGEVSVEMYINALKDGKEQVYDIRLMVVGAYGVGKTTLTKRLLKNKVNISSRHSTNGIDVHVHRCAVKVPTGEWIFDKAMIDGQDHMVRIAKLIENALKEQSTNENDNQSVEKSSIEALQEVPSSVEGNVNADRKDTAAMTEGEESHTASVGAEVNAEILHNRQVSAKDFDKSSFESLQKKVEKLDIDDEKRNEILTAINNAIRGIRSSDSQHKQDIGKVSIWDFGGQLIFYSTHQIFLSARAIYIIVIDLSKSLGDNIKDECFHDASGSKYSSFKDRLIFWLNSIHTYSMEDDDSIPPVLLVATHLDKVKGKKMETVQNFFTGIRRLLGDKPVRFHLVDEDFAIDNTKSDPRLDDLRQKIYEIASKQKHWGEEIPARWINLENALMKHKSEGHKLISFDDVKKMNRSLAVSITHEDELVLCLRFEHEIGNIIFFDDEWLKQIVVLQPQWLIDAFKCIITAKEFCIKSTKLAHSWYEFFDKAILREELINGVWENEKQNCFYENKTHILNLMERMDILARPSIYPDIRISDPVCVNYYLAPCMLSKIIGNTDLNQVTTGSKASPFFCYEFLEMFVPPAVFHRLLAACMGKWPVVQRKEQLMLFCGFGLFYITDDRCNRLLLSHVQHIIQIRLFHYGGKSDLDVDVAVSVREFITKKLNSIIRLYHRRMPYELCMKCEKSDHDSLEGMLKVNDLLKFKCMACDNHENLDSHAVDSSTMLNVWCSDLQMHEKVYGYNVRDAFKDDLLNPEALLQRNAARHGLLFRQESLNGGNSFFHAISDQLVRLNLPFKDHLTLRESVVKYIRNLEKKSQEGIKAHIDGDIESYLTNMLQAGTAADPVVIQCTAQLLNKKIIIASSSYEADKTEVREQIVNAESADEGSPVLIGKIYDGVYQSLAIDENFSATDKANSILKKQIRKNYRFLVQNTDLLQLTDVLLEEDIFTPNEKERVENANPNTTERRNRILLDLLMKQKEQCIPTFLRGLKEIGHEDLVDRIHRTCITENYQFVNERKDAALKDQIKRNYEMLVMDTILENKVDEFYSQGLFSLTEKEIVENAQPNTIENKNRLFLEIFLTKRNDSAHVLINAFIEEGREDIVRKIKAHI